MREVVRPRNSGALSSDSLRKKRDPPPGLRESDAIAFPEHRDADRDGNRSTKKYTSGSADQNPSADKTRIENVGEIRSPDHRPEVRC